MLSVESATVIFEEVKKYLKEFAEKEEDEMLAEGLAQWAEDLKLKKVQNMPSVPQADGDLYLLKETPAFWLNIFAKVGKQTEVKGIILLTRR